MHEPRRDESTDLYQILEVSPRASHDVIHAAYRVLARNAHPDRNPGSDAEQRIRMINAAYEVIGNPAQRARYDLEYARAHRHERTSPTSPDPVSTQRPSSGSARTRVLQMRPVVIERSQDERFPALNLPAVLVVFAFGAFGALLLMLVWMSLDSVAADDKLVFEAPAYSRPLVDNLLPGYSRPLVDPPTR